jgi:hypothetical protein
MRCERRGVGKWSEGLSILGPSWCADRLEGQREGEKEGSGVAERRERTRRYFSTPLTNAVWPASKARFSAVVVVDVGAPPSVVPLLRISSRSALRSAIVWPRSRTASEKTSVARPSRSPAASPASPPAEDDDDDLLRCDQSQTASLETILNVVPASLRSVALLLLPGGRAPSASSSGTSSGRRSATQSARTLAPRGSLIVVHSLTSRLMAIRAFESSTPAAAAEGDGAEEAASASAGGGEER